MATIGERIESAMADRGMNAARLAVAAHLSRSAISQILNGKTKAPKPENLFAIADALKYEARFLATGKGPARMEESSRDRIDISDLTPESKARLRAIVDAFKEPTEVGYGS